MKKLGERMFCDQCEKEIPDGAKWKDEHLTVPDFCSEKCLNDFVEDRLDAERKAESERRAAQGALR